MRFMRKSARKTCAGRRHGLGQEMRKHARKKPAVVSDELQSEMMTAREVAQYLHRRHRSNVYWLVLQKALPGLRLGAGGGLRFRRSEIDQWIAARLGMKKISAP